jgi:ribosomal protein S12 methylthiotransferase
MTGKTRNPITVGFVALGCPKNVVDSEKMLARIAEAGLLITGAPERADVVVINTCGFIAPAQRESFDAIRQAVANKKIGNVRKVIVAGCLSQRLGDRLLEQVEGIDAVVGLEQRDAIADVIRDVLAADRPRIWCDPVSPTMTDDRNRLRLGPPHAAYLRISEGCSHRCSFCTIPAIRGPFRSKPPQMVLEEARELAASGVVELNLIGQDTTRYGRDLNMKDGLARLLRELEPVAGLSWIRVLYAYPTAITETLIEVIAASEKVVHYLDIPLQHASDPILRAMRRPDTKASLQRLVEKLRAAMSDIVLRTTLIVGFPGETRRQFHELLAFVRWARFDALGAFPFYPEAGTPAAALRDQVRDEVKQARLEELMLTQQAIAFAKNRERVGSRLTCLVDSCPGPATLHASASRRARPRPPRKPHPPGRGRFYGQALDIDGLCLIENCSAAPGRFVEVRAVGAEGYDLRVAPI